MVTAVKTAALALPFPAVFLSYNEDTLIMLVTRIIGDCPGCKAKASFGNVFIHGQVLTRGCMCCEYRQESYLPDLSKSVIYLDQFFFSHAFRSKVCEFVECASLISELAHDQLLVCPRSSIHEMETHQWRSDQKNELWSFIKRTSRGVALEPTYEIKHNQILRGFTRYLSGDNSPFPTARRDAFTDDINVWENYFWVDVAREPENVELTRKLKEEAASGLVALFPEWREGKATFEEHLAYELRAGGGEYIRLYLDMLKQIAGGNYIAIFTSPIDSQIVEHMARQLEDQPDLNPLQVAREFFDSRYYADVPREYISAGLVAVLRDRVKTGQFVNSEKALEKLRGFFFDLDFIASYAPYCDAMLVDSAMLPFVTDPRLDIQAHYGIRFFAKSNWSDFITYLTEIRNRKTPELARAIELAYPSTLSSSGPD